MKYFTVTKKMYADQKMLGQHGDMSGSWTPKQLEIIRNQGLKKKQLEIIRNQGLKKK